jgi:hypothetical protein
LNILRAQPARQFANARLLNAQLAELTTKLTKLACQRANALTKSALLLTHRQELRNVLLAELTKLEAQLTLLLRALQTKLTKVDAQSANILARRSLLPRGRQTQLRGKVLQLARLLNAGQAQLTALQSATLGQLLGRKAQLPGLRCRLKRRPCTRLTKLPGQSAKLLLTALLLFESLLCALRGRFKARRPHLRRGPPLLLQDIAPKLLLGHGLARSAECACANGLRAHTLLGDLSLPPDVRKRLLDCRILKLTHKRSNLRRVKPAAGARQSRNALLRRRAAHARRAHQRLLGRRSRSPCAGRGNIRAQLRAADLGTNAASQPAHRARTRLRGLLPGANAAKQLPDAFLPQSGAKA